jgi:hypothetical protein
MMTWTVPMKWTDRDYVGRDMVVKFKGHGIEFDESMIKIASDFEIDGPYSF